MNNYKIAIVGAGICGLYLAQKLSEKGHSVTIFEKKGAIGKEACSGLFSEKILRFIPESRRLIQNQIDYCSINFPRKTIKIKFSERFLVMNHYELDRLAAALAEKAGAKIFLKHNLTKKNLIGLEKRFEKIIGCDGANSQTREFLGLKNPQFYLGIQGFVRQNDFSNFVETWPTKSGFIWKIPRGGEVEEDKPSSSPFASARVTEYGIMEKPQRAKKLFDKFLRKNNLFLEEEKSAVISQGLVISKNNSITLCGDAAGLTKPWSGGGVIWGLTAADILLKNFPDLLKYQKEMIKKFLPKIIFSRIAKKTVYLLGFNAPWLLFKNYTIESDFLL